jgi:tetratricopeptide (TPR) repeat protein
MGYDAFISYSHAADGCLAPALQSALHRFAKPWWKLRAISIFRDETSLVAAHDLTGSIRSALEGARYFILLASPGAASSKWVGREVGFWLERKSIEHILIVLTSGHIAWDEEAGDFDWATTDAVPQTLAAKFKAEPLWVDLTWVHSTQHLSARDPRFQQAIARLAAPLHGKSLDEIAGEEVRHHRKTRRLVRSAVASISLLAAAAIAGAWLALQGQRRAEHNLNQALIAANSIERIVAKDLQDLAGVSVALRMRMLQRVEPVLSNLDGAGQTGAVQSTRAITLAEVASAYGVLGKYDEATKRVEKAIDILAPEVKAHPSEVSLQVGLAKSYKTYADVLWWQRKDLHLATAALERSIALYAGLIDAHPGHGDREEWKLFRYRALVALGDIHFDRASITNSICTTRQTCLARAQDYFALALKSALAFLDREGFAAKNSVLVSRERLGKVYEALDEVASAETTYNELLREYELISEAQPDNSKWKENLMAILWRVGRIDEKNCRLDKALANYKQALELSRKLRRAEPDRLDWNHELSLSLKHVARAYEMTGDIEDARAHYHESLEINQALVEKQPGKDDLKADRREIEAALVNLGGTQPSCPLVPQVR